MNSPLIFNNFAAKIGWKGRWWSFDKKNDYQLNITISSLKFTFSPQFHVWSHSISPLKNNLHIKLRRNRDFCKLLWLADILDFFFGAFACAWRRIIGEGCSGELDFRLILILIQAFCCLTLMIRFWRLTDVHLRILRKWCSKCEGLSVEAERQSDLDFGPFSVSFFHPWLMFWIFFLRNQQRWHFKIQLKPQLSK